MDLFTLRYRLVEEYDDFTRSFLTVRDEHIRRLVDAVRVARTGASYVLTKGTGSGRSLAYLIPSWTPCCARGWAKGSRPSSCTP